jgi:hypothetical protein
MSEASGVKVARKPWGEAVATFFTCLALGPPVGGIVLALTVALSPSISGVPFANGTGFTDQIYTAFFVGLFAIPFSYIIGGLQAAATGLSFSAYGWKRGRPPFWFAVATAAAVFAGATVAGIADSSELPVAMTLVHTVPTFLCWLIIRTYWPERLP